MFLSKSHLLKLCLFLSFGLISFISGSKKINETVIMGSIEGIEDQWVKIETRDIPNSRTMILDSFHIVEGRFMFKINVDKCIGVNFLFHHEDKWKSTKMFFIDESSHITIDGNIDKLDQNNQVILSVQGSKTNDESLVYIAMREKQVSTQISSEKFIKDNPDSQLSGVLLLYYMKNERRLPIDTKLIGRNALFIILSKDVKDSYYGKQIKDELKIKSNSSQGASAFDFTTQDVNDQTFTLSKLSAKYIIINFWSAGFKQYIGTDYFRNPSLLSLYDKYHDAGLEVVSVTTSRTLDEMWLDAIKNEGIEGWTHIKNKPGKMNIYDNFDVESRITTFLLDKDLKILKRVNQHDSMDELVNYVETLF